MADETAAAETGAPEITPDAAETNGEKRKKLLRILAITVVAVVRYRSRAPAGGSSRLASRTRTLGQSAA